MRCKTCRHGGNLAGLQYCCTCIWNPESNLRDNYTPIAPQEVGNENVEAKPIDDLILFCPTCGTSLGIEEDKK